MIFLCPQRLIALSQWTHWIWILQLENICKTAALVERRVALGMWAMFVAVYSWAELCLTFVPDRSVWAWWYFRDKKSTEARCAAKMWEGSWWGCLWLIFPLATWQGEDKALIMNCDTLMSLSSSDNTWSALLPFNLWYQWGKLQANKGFVSLAKKEHDFKNSALVVCSWYGWKFRGK